MGKRKKDEIKIQFCGANGMVTGSSTYLEFPHGLKMLIDIGLMQDSSIKFEVLQEMNQKEMPFDVKGVSACILTHGHL